MSSIGRLSSRNGREAGEGKLDGFSGLSFFIISPIYQFYLI
jgi:hypothetical protein